MTVFDWLFVFIMVSFVELLILGGIFDGPPNLNIFNPVKNYERWTNLNWFGVAFFTLVLNIICPVLAACYWFWKLCTVGRKG